MKRFIGLVLALALLVSTVPVAVIAEESGGTGLCAHHTQHTADCGYQEGIPAQECLHVCDAACQLEIVQCIHPEHGQECYALLEDGVTLSEEPVNCTHTECTVESGCISYTCGHQHNGECGYNEGAAEQPCQYVCFPCAGLCEHGSAEADCEFCNPTEPEKCIHENEAEGCALCAAIANVKTMIDALPSVEEMQAMDQAGRSAIYEDAQAAADAYNALPEEDQARVGNAEKMMALHQAFSELTEAATSGTLDNGFRWELSDRGQLFIMGTGEMPILYTMVDDVAVYPWEADSVSEVTICDGITSVSEGAFLGHERMIRVYFPLTLTEIQDKAFMGCVSLAYTWFEDHNIVAIGESAFSGCSIEEIIFSAPLETIAANAFAGCHALTSISFPLNSELKVIGADAFAGVTAEISCPAHWSAEMCQQYGGTLTWAPYGATGENAGQCGAQGDNLTWTLSEDGTLTITGSGAMMDYELSKNTAPWVKSAVKRVVFEDGITHIGSCAFYQCTNLTSVSIPASVTSTGTWSFETYPGVIQRVDITDLAAWCNIEFGGYYKTGWDGNPLNSGADLYINGVLTTDIVIPSSVNTIADGVFHGFDGLTSVVIPEGVTTIGAGAFSGCANLRDITVPNSVTAIEEYAFSGCTSLTRLPVTKNVTSVGFHVFSGCTGLTSLRVPARLLNEEAFATFSGCTGLTSVTLEDDVTVIPDNAFAQCTSLTSIMIPASVKHIDGSAFEWCDNLRTFTFLGDAPQRGADDWEYDYTRMFIVGNTWESDGMVPVTAYYPADNPTWTEEIRAEFIGNIAWIASEGIKGLTPGQILEIDGKICVVDENGKLALDGTGDRIVTAYQTAASSLEDPLGEKSHSMYPTGITVEALRWDAASGGYTMEKIPALDNIITYKGTSIRMTGNQGIRIFTAINEEKRAKLIDGSLLNGTALEGYKLTEYGTLFKWAKSGGDLVYDPSVTGNRSIAYGGGRDAVFSRQGGDIWYTGMLVNLQLDLCDDELLLRPYMVLENAKGEQIVIHGGTLQRNIGYVAYQNKDYKPNKAAEDFIWSIIRAVYGKDFAG